MRSARRGFTLVEVLVATVLLSFVLLALHQAHLRQRAFTDWQQRIAESHDGYRIANSVLGADLREAVIAEGDVVLRSADDLWVRSPQGFGIVCDRRDNPPLLALANTLGTMPTQAGDSVLVYTSGGWRALSIDRPERPTQSGLQCAYGRPEAEHAYRMARGETDSIQVGAPLRSFEIHRYHTLMENGDTWLARTDASGTEALVGPLAPRGLRFQFVDATGRATADAGDAVGVETRIVMRREGSGGELFLDTLEMVFRSRNQ